MNVGFGKVYDYLNGTVGTVAVQMIGTMFVGGTIDKCEAVLITVETANVNFLFSGTSPGTGVGGGHSIAAGTSRFIRGQNTIRNLRFISQTATAATINVTLLGD